MLKNEKGQAAIFIALIFQVLFVFFAMIVNVGMLVHYKINLQNSVDLAAYYAAMKQAENLNAIAHVNYQIRQSWKLLSWRYRVLGSSGLHKHAAGPLRSPLGGEFKEADPTGDNDEPVTGAVPRDFCVQFSPTFQNSPAEQSTCWDYNLSTVTRLPIPQVIFGFAPINAILQANARNFRAMADASVEFQGIGNYWVLAQFIYGWRADSKNRRDVIRMIANDMSTSADDFKDLEGESVLVGVQKTLKNNLAEGHTLNTLKLYNPLTGDACGATSINETPKWLVPIEVSPAYIFRDQGIDGEGYQYKQKFLPDVQPSRISRPESYYTRPDMRVWIDPYEPYIHGKIVAPEVDFRDIVGFEKNPWCMAYVGITATTTAKLPFMPIGGGFTMKATAFAKPFGGRIGPWYEKIWAQGSPNSGGGTKVDSLIPPRELNGNIPDPGDPSRLPNFSRYVGDVAGMISKVVQRYYVRPLFMGSYNWKIWAYSGFHVEDSNLNPEGDIIAYSPNPAEGGELMRKLEIGAIVPDIFDITYYSIETNFGEHYLPKLQKHASTYQKPVRVRSDMGWRETDENLKTFSIKDQIEVFKGTNEPPPVYDPEKLFFSITEKAQTLTSWAEASLLDYSFNKVSNRFGRCEQLGKSPEDLRRPTTAGDCVKGGRTGFSVKFVSERFLNDRSLVLGGEGTSGAILNPPPQNF